MSALKVERAYGAVFVLVNTTHQQVLAKGGQDLCERLQKEHEQGKHPEFDLVFNKVNCDRLSR